METIQVPQHFTPRPYQLKVLQQLDGVEGKPETKKKRALLRWHRRAGKDVVCFAYMVKQAAIVPGNYFYVFPTATQAKKAVWHKVFDSENGIKLLDIIPKELLAGQPNGQELLIKFKNNSTIQLVGVDKNDDAIRGVSCHGAVLSEFAYQDPEAYKVLMPSIREADGWMIINSTPDGRNHFYEMEQRVKDSDQWLVSELQTMWPDKPNYSGLLSPEQLQEVQQLEGYSEEDMEREYGVCYATGMKGSFYIDLIENARKENRIGMYPHEPELCVYTGWDLGYNDDTSIWCAQIIDGTFRMIDCLSDSGKPWSYYIGALIDKGYRVTEIYLPHDGSHKNGQTGLSNRDVIQTACDSMGLRARVEVVDKLPIQNGINAVRRIFHKLYFNEPAVHDSLEMLELYHKKWDKKRKVFMKEPQHDWTSHCADALRTFAVAVDQYMLDRPRGFTDTIVTSITDYDLFE